MMRVVWTLLVIISVVVISGCRSTKNVATEPTGTDSRSVEEHFDALTEKYSEWKDVNIPFKFELSQPRQLSVSGRAAMVRGESVLLSLRFLGMEVANVYITRDSIFATDKIHKYYLAENLDALSSHLPVTVNDVQDMLLGQAFLLEHGTMKKSMKKQVSILALGEYWAIAPKKSYQDIEYAFGVTREDNLKALTATRDGLSVLQCVYENPKTAIAGEVVEKTSVSAMIGSTSLQFSFKWDIDAAKWNSGNIREWSAPKGYKRVYGEALIKALTE